MRILKAIIAGFLVIFGIVDCPAVEKQVGTLWRVTAYCPGSCCCGDFADGYTASGHRIKPKDRFVAANPAIPFGTLVVVPGYDGGRPVPILDRGGAIKGKRIDVFFDTHEEAVEWGVKWLKVEFEK